MLKTNEKVMDAIEHKAIIIAIRTFFADAVGIEFSIWEWLCATNDESPDSPYIIWERVAGLSYWELFEVVDALRSDIVYSMGELNV